MSVTAYLNSIPAGALEALRASPSIWDLMLECRGKVSDLRAVAEGSWHVEPNEIKPAELATFVEHPGVRDRDLCLEFTCRLDKSWAGIHFLLTGKSPDGDAPRQEPLEWAVFGDAPLDATCSLIRILTRDQVRDVARALTYVGLDTFESRYDPLQLADREIYPKIWSQPDALDYLADFFVELVKFYRRAAAAGHGAIVGYSV